MENDFDIFETELNKYNPEEIGIYSDCIINELVKKGVLEYKKNKLMINPIMLGKSKFYRYHITYTMCQISGDFIIDTYYGNAGNKYIKSKLFRELKEKYELSKI